MSLLADLFPVPFREQLVAHEHPDLHFLPGIFSQECASLAYYNRRLILQVTKNDLTIGVPVAVDAEQEEIDHAPMPAQCLLDVIPLQRLTGPVESGVSANLHLCFRLSHRLHHRLDDWLKQKPVLDEIFGENQDPHDVDLISSSAHEAGWPSATGLASSSSTKSSTSSNQLDACRIDTGCSLMTLRAFGMSTMRLIRASGWSGSR